MRPDNLDLTITSVFDPHTLEDGAPGFDATHTLQDVPFDLDGPTAESFMALANERLDRYLLSEELARGAFGIVFAARDTHLDRDVAIKILDPAFATEPEVGPRFLREAAATARVRHPGVVTILDWGQYADCAYIVMELLDGESLAARLGTVGRLLPHDAVEIARQLSEALAAAHGAGVLHRDLKPENVFLVPDASMPNGVRVKILDFGLAKQVGSRRRTGVQTLLGTPQYMSPEQCRCSSTVDHRSDIYALGCLLFELVTGEPPYGGDLATVIDGHQRGAIPSAANIVPCSLHLDALIACMLAKNPADRPPTMHAVRHALGALPMERPGSSPGIPWQPQRHATFRPHQQAPTMQRPVAIAWPMPAPAPRLLARTPAIAKLQLIVLALGCMATGVMLAALV